MHAAQCHDRRLCHIVKEPVNSMLNKFFIACFNTFQNTDRTVSHRTLNSKPLSSKVLTFSSRQDIDHHTLQTCSKDTL